MSTNWDLKTKAFLTALSWDAFGGIPQAVENFRPELAEAARECVTAARGFDVGFQSFLDWDSYWREPLLKHPLGQGEYRFKLKQGAKERLSQALQSVVANALAGDNEGETRFWQVWRDLRQHVMVAEELDSDERRLIADFPATSSLPDYSMWQQAGLAAAFAGTWRNQTFRPAILIFNIGAAQDFVAVARRTQDFFAGSFLLSYLSWCAARALAEAYGPDCIIYPSLTAQPLVDLYMYKRNFRIEEQTETKDIRIANLPNVFTAIIPAGDNAGELAERSVRQAISSIFSSVKSSVQSEFETLAVYMKEAEQLIKNHRIFQKVVAGYQAFLNREGAFANWETVWLRQQTDFLTGDIMWTEYAWPEFPSGCLTGGEATDNVLARFNHIMAPEKNLEETHKSLPGVFRQYEKAFPTVVKNAGATYQLVASTAGRLQATAKNIRPFVQSHGGEPGHKCSLCGRLEALGGNMVEEQDGGAEYFALKVFWRVMSHRIAGHVRPNEHLCAVCLVKRLVMQKFFVSELGINGRKNEELERLFPSTGSIATAGFKAKILLAMNNNHAICSAVVKYVEAVEQFLEAAGIRYRVAVLPKLRKMTEGFPTEKSDWAKRFLGLDGDWLYPESYRIERLVKDYPIDSQNLDSIKILAQEAALATQEFVRDVRIQNPDIPIPSRYLAIIAMDGDNIGKWVNGCNMKALEKSIHFAAMTEVKRVFKDRHICSKLQRPPGALYHMALSQALSDFALQMAPFIVEQEHFGRLIYAGGDDVLAMCPAEEAIDIAEKLRLAFAGHDNYLFANGVDASATIADFSYYQMRDGFISHRSGERRLYRGLGVRYTDGATASTAIVVMHESRPLASTLATAQKILKKKAKEGLGRDAWALCIQKRAGGELLLGAKWAYGITRKSYLNLLRQAKNLWKKGLSSGLAYALELELPGLTGMAALHPPEMNLDELNSVYLYRFSSLLDRHAAACVTDSLKSPVDKSVERFKQDITEWLNASTLITDKPAIDRLDILSLPVKIMLAARFLAGKED